MSSVIIAGDTSGSVTLSAPAVSGSSVLTLPVATDTLVGKATTDTLTNKTLTTPTISSLSSASATALTLQSAGTTAITVDTSQNVGIGTASPTSKLDIYKDGAPAASGNMNTGVLVASYSGSYAINIGANSSGGYTWINSAYQNNSGVASPMAFFTGATERMRIDSSGRVTKPYQTGFIAKGLASQTTYTANQVVVFNTAPYNVGSGYSTSTGKFTAPVAGLYSFTFQIYLNPGNTNAPLAIYVNGTMEIFTLQGVAISGIGLSTLISLAASDYVEVRVRNVAGATATIFNGTDHTQFTGYLLG